MIYIVGGVALVGWICATLFLIKHSKVLREKVELREKLISLEAQVLGEKEREVKLESVFKNLATDVFSQNADSFLKLASERLDKKTVEANSTFSEKVVEIQKLMDPIKTAIHKVEKDLRDVENQRQDQFGRLSVQLTQITQSNEVLRKETHHLASALRRPGVKGSWGELQLKRVVELAGMNSYCDFEEQVSTTLGDSRQRPDMVVRLPGDRTIVVDSKATNEDFLKALESDNDLKRREHLEKHAKTLRTRVVELSRKSYWEQFKSSPEFTVLFVPNEALLYAALEVDSNLLEDAMKDKIVICSPTNLVALLKAVAFGWQQNQMTENAEKIVSESKDLYDRLGNWLTHFRSIGKNLDQTVRAFNASVGSLESRVMPSVKRVKDLGAIQSKKDTKPETLENMPRELMSDSESEVDAEV